MSWRYQPVWTDERGERYYSLCEVYFDKADQLENWTEESTMHPQGNDAEDLQGEIAQMLVDAYRWKPVEFAALKVGMTFERAISPSQAEGLAKMVEATAHNMAVTALADDLREVVPTPPSTGEGE